MKYDVNQRNIKYPAMLFRDGYLYKASNEAELSLHDRRLFGETITKQWRIIDADGSLFRVIRWEKIARTGIKAIGDVLFSNVYALPELTLERQLTPPLFVQQIEPMLIEHRMYGGSFENDEQRFVSELRRIQNFPELFDFLENAL